ncbi:MAG: glycoside hydrolase family 55 protein, partial [Oscillospiraceae bacterium]|nr:glycoside hydrolase family 55 protein [Oscillospiraceae bacterium]
RSGIKILPRRLYSVLEDISLKNQTKEGIRIGDALISIKGVKFEGNVPAVYVQGPISQTFITDCDFTCKEPCVYPAVKIEQGCVYLRNIRSKGFKHSLNLRWDEVMLPDGEISEYCTLETFTFSPVGTPVTLNLPVPPLPDVPFESNFEKWVCVNDFGAVGDGKTDDTAALQAAFDSDLPVVWFQPGKYLVTRTINIPESVRHVHFMYCDIAVGEALRNSQEAGVFRICGDTGNLLSMEKLFQWESCYGEIRMFCHAGKRPLYLRDMHTQSCAMYFNTAPGSEVFLENTACTIGDWVGLRHVPAYAFKGQTVWAHWLNPERSEKEAVNDGGTLWVLGFKCEHEGSIETYNGGETEILGGIASVGRNAGVPFIINDNSEVSAIFATNGYKSFSLHPVAVKEVMGKSEKYLYGKDMPLRFHPGFYFVPLYSSKVSDRVLDISRYKRDALVY